MSQVNTILIVDDDPLGRTSVQALLDTQGYRLAFAGSGVEALAQAREHTPDVILLDVMMPEMDGFEVCQRLRADPLLAEVPIIMLTGLHHRDARLRGIQVGADDFISKPFDRVELCTRVRTITRLDRYRRLLNERARFEWVVDHAEDGYLVVDVLGRVLYANERAQLYLGLPMDACPPEETFLMLVGKQYHCEPPIEWAAWVAPSEETAPKPRYLIRPASASADVFMLQVDLLAMTSCADDRYLIRLRDVTAHMVNQNIVWSFHGQIRHKISTPLTQMLAALSLLKESQPAHPGDRQANLLAIAHDGAMRLQSDIQDIFQYLDAPNRIKPERATCSVAEVPLIVAQILHNTGITAIRVNNFTLECPNGAWLAISSYSIELILNELIENARKFHPHGSPHLDISLVRVVDAIHLHICDDGQTLSPDQLANAWLPYYQGERYFTGQVPGMGLGLPMVAALIWRLGGSCRLYNRTPGPGIGVELVIPLAGENKGAHEQA
jgi:two-component system, cell cycle response regulator